MVRLIDTLMGRSDDPSQRIFVMTKITVADNGYARLRRLDLNLLLVFDALLRRGSVSEAGRDLGLSQSGVSNALARLRGALDDPLFVRTREGMMPTDRALELSSSVREALDQLENALAPAGFDPEAPRQIALACHEYVAAVLLPSLISRLAYEAPGINLLVRPDDKATHALLDARSVHLSLTPFARGTERYRSERILDERFVGVVRRGHALAKRKVTLRAYAAASHVLIAPTGEATGMVDAALTRKGLQRRIATTVNQHALAPRVVAKSDLVLTVAERLAERYCRQHRLVSFSLPLALPTAQFFMMWNPRLVAHPAHQWFRDLVRVVAEDV